MDTKLDAEESVWDVLKGLLPLNLQNLFYLKLIKRDQSREPFNETKLRSGILKATEKRPISSEVIEELISRVIRKVQKMGEREIQSRLAG